jgi:hypothetical protein
MRAVLSALLAVCVLLAGCGPVRIVASAEIPEPLVAKVPVSVALFMPQEFSQYVHIEERWGTDWNIEIGKAQTQAISQLMNAMFDRVIPVDSLNAGAQLDSGISAILEPSVEEYAFVTPRDAGSPFFAVSIKYRVNVYLPDGKLADSWGFTGYGTAPAGGLSNTEPLVNATALAMRDAGAKLAVEFREQAIVRGLLPEEQSADDPGAPKAETVTPLEGENLLPQEAEAESEAGGSPPVLDEDAAETPGNAPAEESEPEAKEPEAKEPEPLDVEAFS